MLFAPLLRALSGPQVEAVLLFCAILVCLFGIMFASEFSGPGELLYERLGELTLAVIGVSIAYYMLVVWTEGEPPKYELICVRGALFFFICLLVHSYIHTPPVFLCMRVRCPCPTVVAVMFPSLKLSFVSGAVEGNRDQVEMDQDGNVVDQGKDLT